MHNFGEHFVSLLKNGTKEENDAAWKEARAIYKDLHKRISSQLQQ